MCFERLLRGVYGSDHGSECSPADLDPRKHGSDDSEQHGPTDAQGGIQNSREPVFGNQSDPEETSFDRKMASAKMINPLWSPFSDDTWQLPTVKVSEQFGHTAKGRPKGSGPRSAPEIAEMEAKLGRTFKTVSVNTGNGNRTTAYSL